MDVIVKKDEIKDLDEMTRFVQSLSNREKKHLFTILIGVKYGVQFNKNDRIGASS